MGDAAATSQVRVGVRIRPLTSKESSEGGSAVVDANPFDRTVSLSKRKFTYDSVFHSNVTQLELYGDVAPPLMEAFLGGYNATVLAYGQTGSGKTFTMGSEAHDFQTINNGALNDNDGLIPRFMSDIFTMLIQRKEESAKATLSSPKNDTNQNQTMADALIDYKLSASFLEVYGEDIHDLLDEERASLPIREDSNGEVIVKGLRNTPIASDAEAMNVLNTGTMNRTTAATLMNCTSSRSHAVFTVTLQQTTRSAEGVDVASTSRFTFVDLAGSERMKKTGAEGERAKEGIKINEGLLALGNVINALADEERLARGEKIHVPYRQSKLTRLLQDALGGNSQTLFMACVSPSDTNASETLSTLQYANRARNIKNALTRNVDATAVELQRLRTMTNILKCELIKQKFAGADTGGGQGIGMVDEELLKREDVAEYIKTIDDKVMELSGGPTQSNLSMSFPPTHSVPPHAVASSASVLPSSSAALNSNNSTHHSPTRVPPSFQSENENTMILDVNPEEDLQLIDQLLELQQNNQNFEKEQKDDQDRQATLEGEIEAQEDLLTQLREHLKVYQDMKGKYEQLMCEVHSLESEKKALADELEKAQVDPTKGCSVAIKRKLQKVEEGLARARSETRKHQQLYRQAEQEAQKCKVLERKIQDLKHAKVNLIKKQREDAAKHKEFTNQKTREIHALKRREKNADKKISKMETEAQRYKMNLERSKAHNEKLSDKLKQTESHLMRLLTKRRNESRNPSTRQSRVHVVDTQHASREGFAPLNEELKSIKFMLEKTVSDRVTLSQSRDAYESKVVEHGRLMQAMANEARQLHQRKQEYQAAENSEITDYIAVHIREHEDEVEQLQLQIELIENELEQLRSKYPTIEEDVFEDDVEDDNGPALKMIAKLHDGPVLRTIISHLLESYVAAELQRRNLMGTLEKKESTLKSFENEVRVQNETIDALKKSLDRRRQLATPNGLEIDPFDAMNELEKELQAKCRKLDSCVVELEDIRHVLVQVQAERAGAEEKLALYHAQHKLLEPTESTSLMLRQLQDVLATVGMSREERDSIRERLENCVEDACANMLSEAERLQGEKMKTVSAKEDRLAEMHSALGLEYCSRDDSANSSSQSLNNQLKSLDEQLSKIQPLYSENEQRSNHILNAAETLSSDLGVSLSENLLTLLKNRNSTKRKRASQIPEFHRASMEASRKARASLFKDVENMMKGLHTIDETIPEDTFTANRGRSPMRSREEEVTTVEPGSLSTPFLDKCEKDVKKLRLTKSDGLLSNTETSEKIRSLAKQMHVGAEELSSIVLHGMKTRHRDLPTWWDEKVAAEVYTALSKKGSGISVNSLFTKHLNIIFDTLQLVTHGRRLLSDTLKDVIKESQSVMIATAEGCGMDATDLSKSMRDSLDHIPHLSKEHVSSSIDEMEMLLQATESVSQSEIETLTVLWEGLSVTSSEKSRFWAKLNDLVSNMEMQLSSPFDKVLNSCPAEVEEWVLKSSKDATKVQRNLGVRVFKLKTIHEEVERLKDKQDAKNAIMSLNNELKLLSSKLADFEEKAGDKSRLLNKKVNSASLLEEERFRKQMQGMFSTKLESLRKHLLEWEAKEGPIEDSDLLSEVTRSMLQNSHRIDAWMKEKTRLMHLRTTNTKSRYRATPNSDRTNTSTRPSSSGPNRANQPGLSTKSNTHVHKRNSSALTSVSRQSTAPRSSRPVRSTVPSQRSRSSKSPPPSRKREQNSPKRKALSSSKHNATEPAKVKKHPPPPVDTSEHESSVLLPFGNLLTDTPTKGMTKGMTEKENSTHF